MECPNCGSTNTEVDESLKIGGIVRRYRICKKCKLRFRTEEHVWRGYLKDKKRID